MGKNIKRNHNYYRQFTHIHTQITFIKNNRSRLSPRRGCSNDKNVSYPDVGPEPITLVGPKHLSQLYIHRKSLPECTNPSPSDQRITDKPKVVPQT